MTAVENYKIMEDRDRLLKGLFGQQTDTTNTKVEDIELIWV